MNKLKKIAGVALVIFFGSYENLFSQVDPPNPGPINDYIAHMMIGALIIGVIVIMYNKKQKIKNKI